MKNVKIKTEVLTEKYCLSCQSKNLYKNGFSQGKQIYKCQDCGRTFIDINLRKSSPTYPPNLICPKCGSGKIKRKGKRKTQQGNIQDYKCKNCGKTFVQFPYAGAGTHLPEGEDVWDITKFGLKEPLCKSQSKLVFYHIHQEWLKELAKKFIRYSMTNRQPSTLRGYLTYLNCFSEFIERKHPHLQPESINREVIIDYLEWMNQKNLEAGSRIHRLGFLKNLFSIIRRHNWIPISSNLIYQEDFPQKDKNLPRYIPEYILKQINENLEILPEPIRRMILVIQECGLRVSELLLLNIDCLEQDGEGIWYLRYMQYKMKKEHTIPISNELTLVIQEQQLYIRKHFENNFKYLFCSRKKGSNSSNFIPQPKIMQYPTFVRYLKRLIKQANILDESGEEWDLESHQFRHTVGTRMINNGVPQHIIQRYLGHETPTMTSVYAHIHDKTLKQEIAKYHDSRVVNVAGEVVESTTPELDNDLDLHLLKKKILAQSLPNGSCARPIVLGECPHANACLTCGDFRTTIEFLDQHKTHLIETEKLVQNAEAKGWKRQLEMNTRVRDNLKKILATLESEDNK